MEPYIVSEHDKQDQARSGYADMLYDDERNLAYFAAIRAAVHHLVNSSDLNPSGIKFFHCLDIGTGTGLLSMMVVQAFKEQNYHQFHVTAYEEFKPMAECGRQIVEANNMSQHITIVNKMFPEADRAQTDVKFDLLVAELLDSELIGEGCLREYRAATRDYCAPNCLFVPHKVRLYAELVASEKLFNRFAFSDRTYALSDGKKVKIEFPLQVLSCTGSEEEFHDIQMNRLRPGEDFKRVCKRPMVISEFNFNAVRESSPDPVGVSFEVVEDINAPLVIMFWWDIDMFDKTLIDIDCINEPLDKMMDTLSLAPSWARGEHMLIRDEKIRALYGREVWREHWLQCIYFLHPIKKNLELVNTKAGSNITLYYFCHGFHHAFSLDSHGRARCSCGVHRSGSLSTRLVLNDKDLTRELLDSALYNELPGTSHIGCIKFVKEPSKALTWSVNFLDETGEIKRKVTTDFRLFTSIPAAPSLWTEPTCLGQMLSNELIPVRSMKIKCTQVNFTNMGRINTRIYNCEGFDLRKYNDLVVRASQEIDESIELYYVWEYENIRVDPKDYELCEIKYCPFEIRSHGYVNGWKKIDLDRVTCVPPAELAKGWALVFWAEIELKNTGKIISTGPLKQTKTCEEMEWFRSCKQEIHFLYDLVEVPETGENSNVNIRYDTEIHFRITIPKTGHRRLELKRVEGGGRALDGV